MPGWIVPPPRKPKKSKRELTREREAKVRWLAEQGILASERIRQALLKVPREEFIPQLYRDYAYLEVPLPLPGENATISCPHSYPLFYEPLGLAEGHEFLEIGLGSGYGAAIAREVVGSKGLVVAIEIDPVTFEFARQNLEKNGYTDVVLVHADGGLGYAELQPYDRIAITAACREVPPPVFKQLKSGGKLLAPVIEREMQNLMLYEKTASGINSRLICEVLYVSLRGEFA